MAVWASPWRAGSRVPEPRSRSPLAMKARAKPPSRIQSRRRRGPAFQASSASSCRKLIETVARDFGGCDILINNAGINRRKPPEQISEQEWHEILDVNLGAALFCAQAAYPHMKAAGRGKIVNIGSMYSVVGAATVAAYAGESEIRRVGKAECVR